MLQSPSLPLNPSKQAFGRRLHRFELSARKHVIAEGSFVKHASPRSRAPTRTHDRFDCELHVSPGPRSPTLLTDHFAMMPLLRLRDLPPELAHFLDFEQLEPRRWKQSPGRDFPMSDKAFTFASTFLIVTLIVQIVAVIVYSARFYSRALPVWRFRIDDYLISVAFVRHQSSPILSFACLLQLTPRRY